MQDPSSMSDAELLAALGQPAQQPQARPQAQSLQAAPMAPSGAGSGNLTAEALFPALVQQESRGRAGAVGPDTQWGNALGRTQMLPATAREMAQRVGVPFDETMLRGTSPEASAYQDRLGLAYLQQGFERTGNPREALMYYHGGPDRRLWGPKTRRYADEVLGRHQTGDFAQVSNGAPQAAQDDFGGMSDEALMAALQSQPEEPITVEIDQGVIEQNGRVYDMQGNDLGSADQYAADQGKDQQEREALRLRRENPVYQAEYQRARGGAEAIPGGLSATLAGQTLGGNGIVPYLTGAVSYADGFSRGVDPDLSSQAARDATRDVMARYASERPAENLGYQLLGGLFTPGIKGAGDYIGAASGAQRFGRAAAVGGATGAASGALNATGDGVDRLQQGALGGVTGAATMGALDAGAQRAFGGAARAGTGAASAPRQLSRMGIDLTPAQMVSEVPGVGSFARKAEDVAAGYLPFVQGARNRSIEGFDRAIAGEALAPVNGSIPRGVRGRDLIREGRGQVSGAYRRTLDPITVAPDQQWGADLTQALAAPNLSRGARNELSDWTADLRSRFSGPIDGQTWKQIDSELSAAINTAPRPLASSLREVREAFEQALERSAPGSLAEKKAADAAYANFERIGRAAANPTTSRNEGLFSSSNLNSVLARSEQRAFGQGEARLQATTDLAERVLPATLGDTGSGQRAIVGAMALGGAHFNPAVAVPVIAASLAYSRPAQIALNAVYRATDSRQAMEALGQLQRLAGRNPALQPYYEEAARRVLPGGEPQSPAPQPVPSPAFLPTPDTRPAPRGLFGTRRPQMGPQQ